MHPRAPRQLRAHESIKLGGSTPDDGTAAMESVAPHRRFTLRRSSSASATSSRDSRSESSHSFSTTPRILPDYEAGSESSVCWRVKSLGWIGRCDRVHTWRGPAQRIRKIARTSWTPETIFTCAAVRPSQSRGYPVSLYASRLLLASAALVPEFLSGDVTLNRFSC